MTPKHLPRLVTGRLELTLPSREAAPRVMEYFRANQQRLRASGPAWPEGFLTEDYWQEKLERNRQEFTEGKSLRFFLLSRGGEDAPVIGACSFTEIIRGPMQACYLGYGLDGQHEGQGLMFEALQAAIPYAFHELKLHRIMAGYVPTNERSGWLLRRLGFAIEGYARDYLYLDGAWRDHVLTGLVNPKPSVPE